MSPSSGPPISPKSDDEQQLLREAIFALQLNLQLLAMVRSDQMTVACLDAIIRVADEIYDAPAHPDFPA